ncbi:MULTISPECIES: FadR/GntR family transcriptional regulator [Arthrobacter]|uniref:FadR/GntR family transcriptional regulator n=2 Tax=Arthrobacter TaxID=1663 RepID=A0ABU9KI51_9MICC|nr:FadR/GntR family transcriptional regulator [Arthrobacter sp. YJM1]MDP5226245.1 FadR/GntR family transcriptional regulator [Arthrobacter sp. YJM1]
MKPVQRVSLVDAAVEQLKHSITSGDWPVGTRIPTEQHLVELLGVSRSSVREAVRSLVQLGLLETRQGNGTFVIAEDEMTVTLQRSVEAAEEGEVLAVRRALDILAAREAATRRTAEDLELLRQSLNRRTAAVDAHRLDDFVRADVGFHLGVARAAHNQLLLAMYLSFEGSLTDSVARSNAHGILEDDHSGVHRRLFDAIVAGDPEQAGTAARRVLDDHRSRLARSHPTDPSEPPA